MEVIVNHLASFVDTQVEEWCCHADLISMCQTRQKQLLEMKVIHAKHIHVPTIIIHIIMTCDSIAYVYSATHE